MIMAACLRLTFGCATHHAQHARRSSRSGTSGTRVGQQHQCQQQYGPYQWHQQLPQKFPNHGHTVQVQGQQQSGTCQWHQQLPQTLTNHQAWQTVQVQEYDRSSKNAYHTQIELISCKPSSTRNRSPSRRCKAAWIYLHKK